MNEMNECITNHPVFYVPDLGAPCGDLYWWEMDRLVMGILGDLTNILIIHVYSKNTC